MQKYILIILGIVFYGQSFSQVDAIKIAAAQKAYNNNDYQIALDELSEVTSKGRVTKLYLYYKGYSNYKLKQYDSAEVYLKKYLLKDINNTDVANTLADIDYERKKNAEKEEQRKKQEELLAERKMKKEKAAADFADTVKLLCNIYNSYNTTTGSSYELLDYDINARVLKIHGYLQFADYNPMNSYTTIKLGTIDKVELDNNEIELNSWTSNIHYVQSIERELDDFHNEDNMRDNSSILVFVIPQSVRQSIEFLVKRCVALAKY